MSEKDSSSQNIGCDDESFDCELSYKDLSRLMSQNEIEHDQFGDSDFMTKDEALEILHKHEEVFKEEHKFEIIDYSKESVSSVFSHPSQSKVSAPSWYLEYFKGELGNSAPRVSIGTLIGARTENLGRLSEDSQRERPFFGTSVSTPVYEGSSVISIEKSADFENTKMKRMISPKTSSSKRYPKTTRHHSLDKHSSIPVRPSCSEFCENPSFVMNTGVKKTNKKGGGKKKQLIDKDYDFPAPNFSTDMIPSFESKGDQWSSIYKYCLELEKPSKKWEKANPVICEQPMSENVSYIDHISKENDQLSGIADVNEDENTSRIKCKNIDSSTPLASRNIHGTLAEISPSNREFSPILLKDHFISSTPISSQVAQAQQNQICNVSRISFSGRRCSSLHDINNDSSVQLQKYSSSMINSSVLLKKLEKSASFINCTSHSQNSCHCAKTWLSHARREHSALGKSQCLNRSHSFSAMESFSSIASKCSEDDFEVGLSELLEFCGQTRVIPFKELYEWSHTTVRKIAEGIYAEIFSLVQNKIASVVKIIPFSEDCEDHDMLSIESILSEATISQCLSELRNNETNKTKNFTKLKSVHVVRGCYPDQMLVAWDKFSASNITYNSRPDIYNEEQLFAIIELEYAGKDMTCFVLRNAAEGESILKQISISLAIAEEVYLFEHRDLRLGNILVQRNASKTISYVLGGKAFSIPNHGLVVTIMGFSFSRVLHKGCIFYSNLADDPLFDQTGDILFSIFKEMKLNLNNKWDKCLLYSNVLWLTFLSVKLLASNYSRPSSKKHEEGFKKIKNFKNNLENCINAFDCLQFCNIPLSFHKTE